MKIFTGTIPENPYQELLKAHAFLKGQQSILSQMVEVDLDNELNKADKIICELCKRLNPHHATADYGKGCDWCQDRDSRIKELAKAYESQMVEVDELAEQWLRKLHDITGIDVPMDLKFSEYLQQKLGKKKLESVR